MGICKEEQKRLDRWNRNQETMQPVKVKGKRNFQEGHLAALKHGIFADRCLTSEEKVMFDNIIEKLHEDFQFNKSSDFLQVELLGIYSVKLVRAQSEGNAQASEILDRMIRSHMRDLKTTKLAREGEETKGPQTSPAEWAASLLEDEEQPAVKKCAPVKKPKKSADNTKRRKCNG